ncbi:kinase [Neobacillus sp. LXY-4]|uniref:kinase n=1 Tax=Neobacillus sp. LXY-4 TaxID=3379826 RepID=UPI003EDEE4B8
MKVWVSLNNFNGKISIEDLSGYKFIGKGGDGAVYQLTTEGCVKVFAEEETQKMELMALQLGQSSPVIPRLYGYGTNYIIMEYVNGISLKRYLRINKHLPESIAVKILYMLDELKAVGYTRIDVEVRHILFNHIEEIKVIDLKRALTTNRTVPYKLLTGLRKFGYLNEFLKHVKKLRPSLISEWKDIMND